MIANRYYAIFLAFFLSGCNTLSKLQNVWVDTVSISVDEDANNRSATAIDLVFFFKKELMDDVAKLSSHDYFKKMEQLVRDNPKIIQIVRWELAPGQSVLGDKIQGIQGTPIGAMIFASYTTPGDHRIMLGLERNIQINLKANDLFVIEKVKQ